MRRDASDVLNKARGVYETARIGLADLEGPDPARRLPGLHSLVVFGRAVTFVLQNLRTIDKTAFDAWYAPFQEEMRADPLMRYFHKLRSTLEKEGLAAVGAGLTVGEERRPLRTRPGVLAFIVDESGAGAWHATLSSQGGERRTIQLESSVEIRWELRLPGPTPTGHLGQLIEDDSPEALGRLYLAYVGRLLAAADARFRS